jgi:hypothetical protein
LLLTLEEFEARKNMKVKDTDEIDESPLKKQKV